MKRCKNCKKESFIKSFLCGCKPHRYYVATAFLLLVVFVSASIFSFGSLQTKAAPTIFYQNDWSGGASGDLATGSPWAKYASSSNINSSNLGEIKLNSDHKGWSPSEGKGLFSNSEGSPHLYNYVKALDGSNSVIVTWCSSDGMGGYDAFAQRINSDGSVGGGSWSSSPKLVDSNFGCDSQSGYSDAPRIVAASDGVYIMWTHLGAFFVKQISYSGVPYPATNNGHFGNSTKLNISPDETSLFVSYTSGNNINILKINASSLADDANWGVNGIVTAATNVNLYNGHTFNTVTASDGIIIAWLNSLNNPNGSIYAQKVLFDGNIAWNPSGVLLSSSAQGYGDDPNNNYSSNINIYKIDNSSYIAVFYCGESMNESVCAQRIDTLGTTGMGSWGPNGIKVTSENRGVTSYPQSIVIGDSLYVKYRGDNGDVQKVNLDGTRSWNVNFTDGSETSYIVADNSGNAFYTIGGYNNLAVRKIGTDGNVIWESYYNDIDYGPGGLGGIATFRHTGISVESNSFMGIWDYMTANQPGNQYKIYYQKFGDEGQYYPSGTLISSTIDVGLNKNWDKLSWSGNIPANTSIEIKTRSAENLPGNISLGKTTYASSSLNMGQVYGPEYAVDGILGEVSGGPPLSWISDFTAGASGTENQWIAIDLGSQINVKKASINFLNINGTYTVPGTYVLQYSNDSTNGSDGTWADVPGTNSVGNPDINSDPVIVDLSFSPISARFFRLFMNDLSLIQTGPNPETDVSPIVIMREFELYSSDWSCEWDACTTNTISSGTSGYIDLATLADGRYIQYRAKLISLDGANTPVLNSISISGADVVVEPDVPGQFSVASLVAGTPVSYQGASVNPSQSFISSISGHYSQIRINQDSPPSRFQLLNNVNEIDEYSISLDGNTTPISLASPLTITINFPYVEDTEKVRVCQDVDHDSLYSCSYSGSVDLLFDYSNSVVTNTSITFSVNSLSGFLVGAERPSPSAYTLPPKEESDEPKNISEEKPIQKVCSNTLEEVQLSPIPPFNPAWGLPNRVKWALLHRRNIFYKYVSLLARNPCSTEVNWILQHNDDINYIHENILKSEEYKIRWGL